MQDYSTLSDLIDMGPCNLVVKLSPLNVFTVPQENREVRRGQVLTNCHYDKKTMHKIK